LQKQESFTVETRLGALELPIEDRLKDTRPIWVSFQESGLTWR
jgi:hypothetical protein